MPPWSHHLSQTPQALVDWDGDGDADVFFGTGGGPGGGAGGGEFWRNELDTGAMNFTLWAGGLEDSSDNTHTAAFGDVHINARTEGGV